MSRNSNFIRLGIVGSILMAVTIAILVRPQRNSGDSSSAEVWTCSMHPQIRLPAPGQCPICGMKLIPVSQLATARNDLETRSGLETETIQHRQLLKEIRTVGKLDYSERQMELITARISGRVDRLYVDFTGVKVKKNDHLVDIYSPELVTAQAELIQALEASEAGRAGSQRLADRFAESNLRASREKLRLWGLLPEQIAEIEKSRKERTHITIYASLGGTVIEKNIQQGQYIKEGDLLYRIANLDPIWVYLDIYESDIAWVRFGQPVEVRLEAFPGETFLGTVAFVHPFLDDATRTMRVRVNLKNPDGRLKPQMYATAIIRVPLRADGSPEPTGLEGKYVCPMHPEIVQTDAGRCPICEMPLERVPDLPVIAARSSEASSAQSGDAELAIPVSAVLDTGRRQIAYRLTAQGAYELVELKLGPHAHSDDDGERRRDYYLVLGGVASGDKVVVRSGFLLDSQRQIEGMPSLLYPNGQAGNMTGHAGHSAPASGPGGGATSSPSPAATAPGSSTHAGPHH